MLGTCGTGVALATVNSSITGASAVLEATMSSAGHFSLLSTDVSTCLDLGEKVPQRLDPGGRDRCT